MEKTEFKSNENELSSNVMIEPQNLIDEKSYKKSYKKLDKDLENIRKSKDKKYKKWVNARKTIDNFYFENTYTLDSIYNRYIHLENNLTIFHNLKIPVLISISFGVFISFSTEVIKGLYNILHNFIIDTNNIINDALSRTSITNEPHIIEAAEQIRNNTLIQFTVPSIAIIFILVIGAFIFFWNIKSEYTLKTYSLHLYRYEADKLKNLIDAKEEEERKKSSELEKQEPPTN